MVAVLRKKSLRESRSLVPIMNIVRTDQPGRVVAVTIIAPVLAHKGIHYHDTFITGFAVVLFVWDLYWLTCKPPKRNYTDDA